MLKNNNYTIVLIIAIVILAGVVYFAGPKSDSSDTALGRAAEDIGDGIQDAGRELRGEKTFGEKVGDAVEDMGEGIKDSADESR